MIRLENEKSKRRVAISAGFAAVSILSFLAFFSVALVSKSMVEAKDQSVKVDVVLEKEITPVEQNAIELEVVRVDNSFRIIRYDYVPPEGEFEEYKKMFKSSPSVFANISAEAISPLYRIHAVLIDDAKRIRSRLESMPGVHEVRTIPVDSRVVPLNRISRVAKSASTFFGFTSALALVVLGTFFVTGLRNGSEP